ncbi:hypothetical protein IE322_05605 [Pseudomonas asiatica]|uniref:hypothetical protein n=1 Tax=Pseudomonas asiatica TaxID=2219225 RepID=UPI0017482A31|nr:hypothetical protein [Pseudomonas asiatica]QOE09538.1 hypothetical protein IE322_05605 [Pseudomonas asiatica]
MTKAIYVDSCAFDALFALGIEPSEVNGDDFQLFVTREVKRELDLIPERADEPGKKAYIDRIANNGEIPERGYFGFGPEHHGFGSGVLADLSQTEFLEETADQLGKPRPTGYPKNHTDRQLLSHSIAFAVLTAEPKLGNQALMDAALSRDARVIRITDFNPDTETFTEFLRRHY